MPPAGTTTTGAPPATPASSAFPHPPTGTRVDEGHIELLDILGVGGYGVCYKALDTRVPRCDDITADYGMKANTTAKNSSSTSPRNIVAVKCLARWVTTSQGLPRLQNHHTEIRLHKLASQHPGVVALHRIIEDTNYTFLVMEFATDGDLFTQILTECRYLGNSELIKDIFLQLIDAVQFCHEKGIFHRDLKPENVLCFDKGRRVAITDFGLATTDKTSEEFRTGSVYHMSPG